jgi:hypothetical protein
MSPRMSEKELLDRLAELPREKTPSRDPWPAISAAIEALPGKAGASGTGTTWWPRAAAAAVVLALAAGILLRPGFDDSAAVRGERVSSAPTTAARTAVGEPNARVTGMLDSLDAEYAAAFREFIGAGESRDVLAQQTVEKIEMGWADMRVAEEALSVALEQNPGDLFLSERMMELRARQLGFLKQLVSLERNNRRLTI